MVVWSRLKRLFTLEKDFDYNKAYCDGYIDGYEDGFFEKCDHCEIKKSTISKPTTSTSVTTWEQIYSDESY